MTVDEAMSDWADEALLSAFVGGDRAAIEALAMRHEAAMVGFASGLLSGRVDLARDAVQETWVRVLRHASGFGNRSAAKTWLYRILINLCHTMRDRERSKATPPRLAAEGTIVETPRVESLVPGLRAAVDSLPDDRRALVLLCYHAGMTHEHAAEALEIPLGTLKSRLHATLASLRASLMQESSR